MRKIITVTLNPAMDKTIKIDNFKLGFVNRISDVRYDIGGKGINVSKLLKKFNINTIATGFLGKKYSNEFKIGLMDKGIETKFFNIPGDTRINTKVLDLESGQCTDINEPGPYVGSEVLDNFLQSFDIMCRKDDIIVLTGGAGPSIPKDIYKTMISIAKSKGCFVILDADGKLLEEGIKAGPDVIKPNQYEFCSLEDKGTLNKKEMIDLANSLREKGIKRVLISLGANGAMYITETGNYYAPAIKVDVKSPVGAGDAMVASLVYSHLQGLNDEQSLRYAAACGAATAACEGTDICSVEQVKKLLTKVSIKILS